MKDIKKEFSGVWALSGITFEVYPGEIHCLVGENGAGKSTLMKVLSGAYTPTEGTITVDGKEYSKFDPFLSKQLGINIVYQENDLVPSMDVVENIFVGNEKTKGLGIIDYPAMRKETQRQMDDLGIHLKLDTKIENLSVSDQQFVKILKALSVQPRVLIMDEPTSMFNVEDAAKVTELTRRIASMGIGIIYISHKMEEILRISDEVTVMRDGAWVATEPAAEMTMERIIKLMVGRELTNRFPPKDNEIGGVLLEVEGLTAMHSKLRDVSFNVHKGEIVGLAGLDGSGRTEVLENIFGVATRKSGVIRLHGKEVKNRRARDAIKNKFALLTEERRATGIFGILDIQENTTISSLKKYKVKGLYLSRKKMEESTEWSIRAMRIKTPSQDTKIRSLSGGNQQKVILGRWLLTDPEVLLLDEPTRGIDVGAKYEIYQLIINLAKEGKAVIMVSSEMPELLGVCDRILVMSGGRLAGEGDAKATTQEEIMTLAAKYA